MPARPELLTAFVAAGAHDLGLVGDSLAVGAAVFLLVGRDAITGGICTFLGIGHNLPPQSGATRIMGF